MKEKTLKGMSLSGGLMNKKLILILLVVFLATYVSALGITPARTQIEYHPGESQTYGFKVINSESKPINVAIIVNGDHKDSVTLSESLFSLNAGEEKTLSYNLKVPDNLPPGESKIEIVAVQLPDQFAETSEAFVGASIAVVTQAVIFVPYPGKYAESDLSIIGPDNGKVTFVMPVVSKGDLDIVRARATLDIYTSLNEKIETLSTNEVSVPSKERKELVSEWDSTNIPPGRYRAVATIIYDEETITLEKEFSVGQQSLDIKQIEVNDFSLGGIAKFEILAENKWSEKLTGVYAEMEVYNEQGDTIANFKSATYDIDPLKSELITAFWDTDGVKEGVYDSSLFINYAGQKARHELKLDVSDNQIKVIGTGYVISEDSGGGNSLIIILVSVIVILVIINLLWFLIIRKKISSKK